MLQVFVFEVFLLTEINILVRFCHESSRLKVMWLNVGHISHFGNVTKAQFGLFKQHKKPFAMKQNMPHNFCLTSMAIKFLDSIQNIIYKVFFL